MTGISLKEHYTSCKTNGDVMTWKRITYYWHFVWGIHGPTQGPVIWEMLWRDYEYQDQIA